MHDSQLQELIKAFDDFINVTTNTIQILEERLGAIKGHDTRCRVSKTTGTLSSIVGGGIFVGSLIAAPFTGGTSVIAGAAIGSTLGIGGAVVNIGTDLVNFAYSKDFHKDLMKRVEERKEKGDKLMEMLNQIKKDVEDLIAEYNLSDDQALYCYCLMRNGVGIKDALYFVRIGKDFSNTALRSGGLIWKNMRLWSESLMSVFGALGVNIGKKTAMSVVRNGSVIFSAVFIIYDIKVLIDTWTETNPTVKMVEDMVENMKTENERLIQSVKLLKANIKISDN